MEPDALFNEFGLDIGHIHFGCGHTLLQGYRCRHTGALPGDGSALTASGR